MPTATIINSIKSLPLIEQFLIVEHILKTIRENEKFTAKAGNVCELAAFETLGSDYVPTKEITAVSEIPDGYMSLEEFRVEAKASLTKILNERGIY